MGHAAERADLRSVAVDSWGVDYGLLDDLGRPFGVVHAYRSPPDRRIMESVTDRRSRRAIYQTTGIQFLPFNTAYQLVAAHSEGG